MRAIRRKKDKRQTERETARQYQREREWKRKRLRQSSHSSVYNNGFSSSSSLQGNKRRYRDWLWQKRNLLRCGSNLQWRKEKLRRLFRTFSPGENRRKILIRNYFALFLLLRDELCLISGRTIFFSFRTAWSAIQAEKWKVNDRLPPLNPVTKSSLKIPPG